MFWRIQVPGQSEPIDITLIVSIGMWTEINVAAPNLRFKGRLVEDLEHTWGFRGTLPRDIFGRRKLFEMKPSLGSQEWLPAVLTNSRCDGRVDVVVTVPDHNSHIPNAKREMAIPAVSPSDIRYLETQEPLPVSQHYLVLKVPANDPTNASLTFDGDEVNQPSFARWSPYVPLALATSASQPAASSTQGSNAVSDPAPASSEASDVDTDATISGTHMHPGLDLTASYASDDEGAFVEASVHDALGSPPPKELESDPMEQEVVNIQVSKDRLNVKLDVPHTYFADFLKGEVFSVDTDISKKFKMKWTVQIGPKAQHTIILQKKSRLSKIMTLSIDGSRFVEASPASLGGSGDWTCEFLFVGERCLNFELNEVSRLGAPLESRGVVRLPNQFQHKCVITCPGLNVRASTLTVDGVLFKDLPFRKEPRPEDNLAMASTVLLHQYGLNIPNKIVETETLQPRDYVPRAVEVLQEAGVVDAAKHAAEGAQVQALNIFEQLQSIDVKEIQDHAQRNVADMQARAKVLFDQFQAAIAPFTANASEGSATATTTL